MRIFAGFPENGASYNSGVIENVFFSCGDVGLWYCDMANFYPRDAMLARVFAIATCLSVCPPHAGIVPSRAKAGS